MRMINAEEQEDLYKAVIVSYHVCAGLFKDGMCAAHTCNSQLQEDLLEQVAALHSMARLSCSRLAPCHDLSDHDQAGVDFMVGH